MNILTFDIEEWFHILDNPTTKKENSLSQETSLGLNMPIESIVYQLYISCISAVSIT